MFRNYVCIVILLFVACVIISPKLSSEQLANSTIIVNGTSYIVPHNIEGGKILDISIDAGLKEMKIMLQPSGNGNFTIDLPRILIDAKENGSDTHYVVLANKHGADFKELVTYDYRELTISFTNNTDIIEIIGTQVVPEFGPLSYVVLMISIISIIAIAAKTRFQFKI